MVTVKMLKPYYIKAEENHVRIVLAYQYFSVLINNKVYQFIPVEAKEIRINRKSQKVVNIDAKFAFQKGKDVIYVTMAELISIPDFLYQLNSIVESYYQFDVVLSKDDKNNELSVLIDQLENQNLRRLIDKALDDKDKETFYLLTEFL
ncbi:IDEAL domain-containing protein [Virgibacillus sp. C22-A2]|uniref:IDEAL domain-containing protein n=1 Tax=Virgibacillus tibetensis TaxID=3042313 RepID=A0ABU6KEK7_9BACI|nr:IDEAL domain-containing protein [Virgibacillus sp. C22-A2]